MNRIKNAKKQSIDGVLFLQGVFKTDCDRIEGIFYEKILDSSHYSKIYEKIPMTFTNLESWPKTTTLLCWNCKRTIKGRPWFEPQSIGPIGSRTTGEFISAKNLRRNFNSSDSYCINVKGYFCSPNCVMRNILIYSRDLSDRLNKISMLLIVYEIFVGVKVYDIQASPLATEMVQYGGNLTEQEYQKKIDDANTASIQRENMLFVDNCKTYFNI